MIKLRKKSQKIKYLLHIFVSLIVKYAFCELYECELIFSRTGTHETIFTKEKYVSVWKK